MSDRSELGVDVRRLIRDAIADRLCAGCNRCTWPWQ